MGRAVAGQLRACALGLAALALLALSLSLLEPPPRLRLVLRPGAALLTLDLEAAARAIAAAERGLLGAAWDERKVAGSYPMRVRFSPDGTLLAVGLHAKEVRVFDARSGALAGWGPSPHLPIYWHLALAWSADGQRLYSGGGDHVVWELLRAEDFHGGGRGLRPVEVWTHDLALDPAGRYLAAAGKDGRLLVWDLQAEPLAGPGAFGFPDLPPVRAWKEPEEAGARRRVPLHAVAWSPDGRFLAAGGAAGLRLFRARAAAGGPLAATGAGLPYTGNPDPKFADRRRIWQAREILELPQERWLEDLGVRDRGQDVLALDWSADGRWLAAATGPWLERGAAAAPRNPLKIWRTADWTAFVLDEFAPRPYAVRFSPDARFLAAGGGGEARIYRVADWTPVAAIAGFRDEVNSLDWSPDGARLAVCAGGERSDKHGDPYLGRDPAGREPFVFVFAAP